MRTFRLKERYKASSDSSEHYCLLCLYIKRDKEQVMYGWRGKWRENETESRE